MIDNQIRLPSEYTRTYLRSCWIPRKYASRIFKLVVHQSFGSGPYYCDRATRFINARADKCHESTVDRAFMRTVNKNVRSKAHLSIFGKYNIFLFTFQLFDNILESVNVYKYSRSSFIAREQLSLYG